MEKDKKLKIEWKIDHTGGLYPNECYLEAKAGKHWMFKQTRKDWFGIPLRYAIFCLTLRLKAIANV